MTMASACPACDAAPLAQSVAERARVDQGTVLSLPAIHCAACIAGVERTLNALPGVRAARVNLSRKRVTVDAPELEPETLVDALSDAGYEALPLDAAMLLATDGDATGRALLLRVAVAGFAMMNVMLFSVAVWSGAAQATQIMFHWLSAAIAIPALLYSAQVFFTSAWSALRVGRLNMDVPISLAIILAAILSVFETAAGGHHVYFDAALSLTFFLLAGRYLDHRTRVAARSASQELSALETPRAVKVDGGHQQHVNVADLRVGDHIKVFAGMRVPVDGRVLTGASDMDRSLLTGESLPVSTAKGDAIAAGELNLTAPLTLEVTATGDNTTLRKMAALVEQAEGARDRYTALADRAAQIYAPGVHLLALFTFIGWIIHSGEISHSLNIAISVLIITCPCALGLAVPAVMTASTGRFFRHGLLVKNGTALERLAEVDTVVFDKTGTLTTGKVQIDAQTFDADRLSVLAALCRSSSHPVSRAIAVALPEGTEAAALTDIAEHPGKGIEARWNGTLVRLGQSDWVGAEASPALAIGNETPKVIDVTETLREGVAETIATLRDRGIEMHVLSGDTQAATDRLSRELGGIAAIGNVMPDQKLALIKEMGDAGKKVLMVGDGLNDTAALTSAYASISPGSALDAARTASDIVILGQSMAEIPNALTFSRRARRRVLENFAIAAGYNSIAIPISVMGFATPLAAAIAMSVSSITVLANALRER